MKKLHFGVGFLGFLLVPIVGWYMRHVMGVPEMPDAERLMYRTAHIYFMYASAANLLLGMMMPAYTDDILGLIRKVASVGILVATVLTFIGFGLEAPNEDFTRGYTRPGAVLLFASVSALVAAYILEVLKDRQASAD